jgi:hypothetical protein
VEALIYKDFKRLGEVIEGVKFKDGIRVDQQSQLDANQDAA